MYHVSVAVNFPLRSSLLTYAISDLELFALGKIIKVPLGKRSAEGCMIKMLSEPNLEYEIKEIKAESLWDYKLSSEELSLYEWMSEYYHYSMGQLIFDCLPKLMKRAKKLKNLCGQGQFPESALNFEQEIIYQRIKKDLEKGFSQHLIHGVTGSGKTFIYLHLIRDIFSQNKSALLLLPEINLTPQFIDFFRQVLGHEVYPYHSAISAGEKFSTWEELKNSSLDKPVLVLGVRSSVFLPINNLGLIIVDEEHDSSFKQNDRCPYHARDVAIKKAQIASVPIVLGSATPSLESYQRFKYKGAGVYHALKNRVSGKLPEVTILSDKEEGIEKRENHYYPFTSQSFKILEEISAQGEQVVVFINRLGFSNYLQCRACGHKFTDPNTDTPLRYFKTKNLLSSAHSDFSMPAPKSCPECQNMKLLPIGFGTEKVEQVIKEFLPRLKVGRFDREVITTQTKLTETLNQFHSQELDVLVGTQMLAKGHNFKNLSTVFILGVDQGLNLPDFRSNEHSYQLITQVLGRAGRFSDRGKVFIQTLSPEIELFDLIKSHDFDQFYERELKIREWIGFPPFGRLIKIYIHSSAQSEMIAYMESFRELFEEYVEKNNWKIECLGPAPAIIERRKNLYTWYYTLRSNDLKCLHHMAEFVLRNFNFSKRFQIKIDVDPQGQL
jgi:primosomal protein N' (replication factor Y) (superfamily II helicase)